MALTSIYVAGLFEMYCASTSHFSEQLHLSLFCQTCINSTFTHIFNNPLLRHTLIAYSSFLLYITSLLTFLVIITTINVSIKITTTTS